MSLISSFFAEFVPFLLHESHCIELVECQNAAKQHTDKLKQNGDIGFPTSMKAWSHANDISLSQKIIDENDTDRHRALLEISRNWSFPIQRIECNASRCQLFLDRAKCFENVLRHILIDQPDFGRWKDADDDDARVHVDLVLHSNNDSLTELRCRLTQTVLINMLNVSGYRTSDDIGHGQTNAHNLCVTHARNENEKRLSGDGTDNTNDVRRVICGIVRGQEDMTATQYIQSRATDMEKMAESKYGSDKENHINYDFVKLGAGLTTFDLLRIKHTNVIQLEQLIAQSSTSKGAAFILYNVARLESILSVFDANVASGAYNKLPELDQIDFALLKEEEEWQLLYVFIDGFPNVLERCLTHMDDGRVAIHSLCTYLSSFVALFSVYYHRVKILTDNIPCLVAVMNARIYLLKAIRVVLLKALVILGIEPLKQM